MPILLFLAPTWVLFDRAGSLVSRFLPDTSTSCPYLEPGSLLHVVFRQSPTVPGLGLSDSAVDALLAQIQLYTPPYARFRGMSPYDFVFAPPSRFVTFAPAVSLAQTPNFDFTNAALLDQTSNLDFAVSAGLAPLSSTLMVTHPPTALPLVETIDSGESLSGVSTKFFFEPPSVTSLRNLRRNGESSGIQNVESLSMDFSSDLRPDFCLEGGEADGDESD